MCGILFLAGRIGAETPDADAAFLKARDRMLSRGPDGAGVVTLEDPRAGKVRLGHRRLSIIDTSERGTQPMWSDCGRYVITYNGEVYNAPELRTELIARGRRLTSTCDTEVIVNGFAEWGEDVVPRLIGMFAFAIWDKQTSILFAARDRVGIKPLHVASCETGIALSSDLRGLETLGLLGGLSTEALGAYLILGYVPTPLSIRTGAAKFEAGTTLVWRPGTRPLFRRYWAPPETPSTDRPADLDALSELVDRVVHDHLLADVPVGLFLSGGLDSALIASACAQDGSDLRALTVAYQGANNENEAPVAARTAARLGLRLDTVAVDSDTAQAHIDRAFAALDEPLAYSAIVSQMAISTAASGAGFKVVLSGDGGDEVFGGYRWYASNLGATAHWKDRFGWLATRMLGPLAPQILRGSATREAARRFSRRSQLHNHLGAVFPALRPDEIAAVAAEVDPRAAEEIAIESLRRHDAPALEPKRRLQRIDLMTFCQDSVLPKVDRTSMATGLEVRPPLLDHRLIEWGLAQPLSEICDATPKGAIRALLDRRGLGFLLTEKKRGFSLKGVPQLSAKAMVRALRSSDMSGTPFGPDAVERICATSTTYKIKIQTLYYLSKWAAASRSWQT